MVVNVTLGCDSHIYVDFNSLTPSVINFTRYQYEEISTGESNSLNKDFFFLDIYRVGDILDGFVVIMIFSALVISECL